MQMDGWQDHLHFNLLGEHVLFPSLHLDSFWHFVVASILATVLCLAERALTYAISKSWSPSAWTQRSRLRKALWKATMYWAVTFLRLMYMLVAMTFSTGLIIVTVTTLSVGQFLIEYLETPDFSGSNPHQDPERIKEPLLMRGSGNYQSDFALHPYGEYQHGNERYPFSIRSSSDSSTSLPQATSRSSMALTESPVAHTKARPADIWIHPTNSNHVRADAAALNLRLQIDTPLVNGATLPPEGPSAWQAGKGKELVRELMGQSRAT